MSILRVLLPAAPSPSQKVAWAVYDAQNRHAQSGASTPDEWPDTQSREAVIAAAAIRLTRVALPPMPADRIASAAAFALEDQLAGPAQAQHIAVSAQRRDGSVEVAVASRALLESLSDEFSRVVAEPAVAPVPPARTWRWYASGAGGGFVRKPDGSALAVGLPAADESIPVELAIAVAQAVRERALDRIEVAFPVEDAQLLAWSAQTSTSFTRVGPWHWDQDGEALASATNLLQGELSRDPRAATVSVARRFRVVAGVALAALMLHVGATIVQWAALRYQSWEISRGIIAMARTAGLPDSNDVDAAAAALSRRFADARHRAALSAPNDALPLLARASPALGALPPGTLKSANYSSGTWTFDLGKIDATLAAGLDRNLALAGLATLSATTQAGTKVRVSPAPGTELP